MKKHTAITLLTAILVVLGTMVYGQQRKVQTSKEDITIETIYNYKDGVNAYGTKNYSYYMDNGQKVLHGAYTENAKGSATIGYYYKNEYRQRFMDAKNTHSFSATYKDGKLDGPASLKIIDNGLSTFGPSTVDYTISGSFNNGQPAGTWKYNMDDEVSGKYSGTVSFSNGKWSAITTKDISITCDDDGHISGKLGHIILTDNFANVSSMDEKQKQIVEKFKKSEIVQKDAPCKSVYILNVIACIDGYVLRKHTQELNLYKYQYRYNQTTGILYSRLPNGFKFEYYTLEKIQDATLDQCKSFCKKYDVCISSGIDGYKFIMDNSYMHNDNDFYFVSDKLKKELGELPIVKEKYGPKYDAAVNLMNKYKGENSIREIESLSEAVTLFNDIYFYIDSKEKEEYCVRKTNEIRNVIAEREYQNAWDMIKQNKITQTDTTTLKTYLNIKKSLEYIGDYKESKQLMEDCNKIIESISEPIYNAAVDAIYGPSIKYVTNYLLKQSNKADWDQYDCNDETRASASYDKIDKIDIKNIPYNHCLSESTFEIYKKAIPIFNILGEYKDSKSKLNTCKKILEGKNEVYKEEIEQITNAKKHINSCFKETVSMTKDKKPGKIRFLWIASEKYYDYYDYKGIDIEDGTYYQSLVLDNSIGFLCPMIDYKIIDVYRNLKDGYYVAKCQIDKKISSKTDEYETYECTFILYNGKIVIKCLRGAAKKIRNDWNEIKDLQKQIADGEITINKEYGKEFSDIAKSYNNYKKQADMEVRKDLKETINRLQKVVAVQTDYGTFTGLRRQAVEKQNNINAKSGKENSDVAKSYATFLKGYNIVMGTDSKEGIKRINELIAIEDKCLDFLSYRQTITDNNAKILAKSKECKNIVSVYSNYMKTADKEWTKEATNAKLQTIISNQDKILMALNSANAKEKDNAVKLAKDKGIENMLKIIQ